MPKPLARIWISTQDWTRLTALAEETFPKETGGIFAGYFSGDDVIVTDVIGPGPNAVHKRWSFRPDAEFHESEIARIYAESNRMYYYIGDWHTHPNGAAGLSRTDRRTLSHIAKFKESRLNSPTMLILAGCREKDWSTTGAWRYVGEGFFKVYTRSLKLAVFD